jgi:hypothetical protein
MFTRFVKAVSNRLGMIVGQARATKIADSMIEIVRRDS